MELVNEAALQFQAIIAQGDKYGNFQHCPTEWDSVCFYLHKRYTTDCPSQVIHSLEIICETYISAKRDGNDLDRIKLEWKHGHVSWFPIAVVLAIED